jgi:hypothetical protein
MFPLHDHSRRALCRLGFVLLCLVPTASVLAWGIAHHLPSHVEPACREVTAWTRCPVEMDSVTHPRPGVTVLHGLALKDIATGETIARLDQLKIEDRNTSVRLVATGSHLSTAGLPRLWEALAAQIEGWNQSSPVEFSAATVELDSSRGSLTFQDVHARLHSPDASPQFDLQLRQAGMEDREPAELHVVCDRETRRWGYELATGPAAFPCVMVATLLPQLDSLGPHATFQGRLSMQRTAQGSRGLIGPAQFAKLELGPLVEQYSARQLTGQAQLDLHALRIADSAIATADGEIRAGPGRIGADVIYALGDALEVEHGLPSNPRVSGAIYVYGELALGFSISSEGVLLSGKCAGTDGMLLTDHRGNPNAREPATRQSIDALIRALTPPVVGYVPATRQAEKLLQLLPVSQ